VAVVLVATNARKRNPPRLELLAVKLLLRVNKHFFALRTETKTRNNKNVKLISLSTSFLTIILLRHRSWQMEKRIY
jgi:hypothetical protein